MNVPVQTAGHIRCDECGATATIDMAEKVVTMGTVSTFFAAHRDCGNGSRILIDLGQPETANPQAPAFLPPQRPHD
jgi:hypothetical protein